MILVVDNYDSFTYNIVQYLYELGANVCVLKHDDERLLDISAKSYTHVIVSPGPKSPQDAGFSVSTVLRCAGSIPLLGVCLGHQCLASAFGGDVVHAKRVMHAKTSLIHHDNQGVFQGLPNPYHAVRYHSLVVAKETLPDDLVVSAWTADEHGDVDEIMGIRHKHFALEGVQFHPESIGSQHGHALLKNFLAR